MSLEEQLLCEFLSYSSTSQIAQKHGLHKDDVKVVLRNCMDKSEYLRISRAIGGRTVANKLKLKDYKRRYSSKMGSSVSNSIKSRMSNPNYRKTWCSKAKKGSVRGNQKIKSLLNCTKFSLLWRAKCSKGGRTVKNLELGIFDPCLVHMRRKWSINGLSKTGRSCEGPLGEHMYNYLEVLVAKILVSQKTKYIYEYQLRNSGLNGFYTVDFVLPELKLLVEVTYWDKIDEKCSSLIKKFRSLRAPFSGYKFVLVTKRSKQDRYKRLLQDYTYVLTPSEFRNFVAEVSKPLKRGNKFH